MPRSFAGKAALAAALPIAGAFAPAPAAALTLEVAGLFGSTPVPLLTGRSFAFQMTTDPDQPPASSGFSGFTGTTSTRHETDAALARLEIDGDVATLQATDLLIDNATRAPNRDLVTFRFTLPGIDTGGVTMDPTRDGIDLGGEAFYVEYTYFIFTVGMPIGALGGEISPPAAQTLEDAAEFVSFSISYCTFPLRTSGCSAGSGIVEQAAFRQIDAGGGVGEVPIPAAGGLMILALGALGLARRRRAA